MPLFKQNLPIPVRGVSQIPAEIRGPGFADDLVNSFPSPASGLGVRKGTTQLAASVGAVDQATAHTAIIKPSEDETYLAIFDANGVRVIDAVTGRIASVAVSSGGFLSTGRFSSAAVDKDLYVASRGFSKAQLKTDKSPLQSNGALITVESGQPSALYRITLDGISVQVRTPDDPPPAVKRPAVGIGITNTTGGEALDLTGPNAVWIIEKGEGDARDFDMHRQNVTGTVSLEITGAPTGVTTSVSPTTSTTGDQLFTVTVNVGSGTAAGTYLMSIKAVATNVESDLVWFTLDVREVGSSGGTGGGAVGTFSITTTDNTESGAPGDVVVSNSWTVVGTGGFTTPVSMMSIPTSMPAGFSLSFSPNPIYAPGTGPNTAAVATITVGSGVAPGVYNLPIKGDAGTTYPTSNAYIVFTVTGGSSGGSFSIDGPASISVPAVGSAVDFDMTVDRTGGYTGLINWTFVDFDAGGLISFVFDPSPSGVSDSTVNVVVVTDPDLADGDYVVRVQASGGGATEEWDVTVHAGTT